MYYDYLSFKQRQYFLNDCKIVFIEASADISLDAEVFFIEAEALYIIATANSTLDADAVINALRVIELSSGITVNIVCEVIAAAYTAKQLQADTLIKLEMFADINAFTEKQLQTDMVIRLETFSDANAFAAKYCVMTANSILTAQLRGEVSTAKPFAGSDDILLHFTGDWFPGRELKAKMTTDLISSGTANVVGGTDVYLMSIADLVLSSINTMYPGTGLDIKASTDIASSSTVSFSYVYEFYLKLYGDQRLGGLVDVTEAAAENIVSATVIYNEADINALPLPVETVEVKTTILSPALADIVARAFPNVRYTSNQVLSGSLPLLQLPASPIRIDTDNRLNASIKPTLRRAALISDYAGLTIEEMGAKTLQELYYIDIEI